MITHAAKNKTKPRLKIALWAVGIAGLIAAAWLAGFLLTRGGKTDSREPVAVVKRGPLAISIAQAGTIRALEQEVITCKVEGQTTLIFLVEEGKRVKAGELLVELDASGLNDKLVQQQITVQNADAAFIRARENLAVVKSQSESDRSEAALKKRFAEEDLKKYTEGEYRQQLMNAESRITLAEQDLQLAAAKLEWSEKLLAESYVSKSECDSDRLAFNRAKLDLELAGSEKRLLEEYTYTRQLAQLTSDVVQAGRALERVVLRTGADIVQAEADLKAKMAELDQQKSREEKIRDQITKTRIAAPRDGLVVYATSVQAQGSFRGNTSPLEAGQAVRERQELIYLPTADRMMAEVQIHESNLNKLAIGLPVIVTVDALQGRTFMGKVTRIAPLPDAGSMWMNPDLKVYKTQITLDGVQPGLRTGMSCMAEIVVDRYDDALYVPVQAVVKIAGAPTVFVREGDGFKPVPVKVGLDNNRMMRIMSGLTEGQTVLLTPPLQAAEAQEKPELASSEVASRLKASARQTGQEDGKSEARAQPADVKDRPDGTQGGAPGDAVKTGGAPTPEERDQMRKRFEAMTPEQRDEMRRRIGGERRGRRETDAQ